MDAGQKDGANCITFLAKMVRKYSTIFSVDDAVVTETHQIIIAALVNA